MTRFRNLLILTSILIIASCTPKTVEGPKTISISDDNLIDIPLDVVLASSDVTPLEFTPESALSESAMFLNTTSGFYLMDPYKKKTVFHFDKKGKFIQTIGTAGQGPGEYPGLTEALITKKGIEILSGDAGTEIFRYDLDGKFVGKDRISGNYSHSFIRSPENGDYYFFGSGNQNLVCQVDDKSLQPVDSFVNRNVNIMTPGVQTFSPTALGKVLFYHPFDNRIFELDGKTINLKYKFDVGTSTPKYDELDAVTQGKMINERDLWFVYKSLENSAWLYLLVVQQIAADENHTQFFSLLTEKKTGKIYSLPDTDEPGPLFRPAFALGEDNILYTSVQPVNIYESEEWKTAFTKRNIPVNPDGNLIVVKIPLDKIIK